MKQELKVACAGCGGVAFDQCVYVVDMGAYEVRCSCGCCFRVWAGLIVVEPSYNAADLESQWAMPPVEDKP